MANVSRPLIALLVGTVAFLALWVVALRPSSSHSGASGGVGAYQSAINKAHQAVTTSNRASIAHGGKIATTPQSTPATRAGGAVVSAAKPAENAPRRGTASGSTAQRRNVVERALLAGKVIVILFYNPAGADDRAVKQELAAVPTRGGRVVKLAVPVDELVHYPLVTNQVPVNSSPTLVMIDAHKQATTIVGFADRFEIAQRVANALAAR